MTRIESVQLTPSSIALHTPFVTALRRTETVDTLVVRVRDCAGRVGWGEAPQVWQVTGESLAGARAGIEEMLAPAVVGAALDDPDDLAVVGGRMQRAVARNFGAKAALDVALHDLLAQGLGSTVGEVIRHGLHPTVGSLRADRMSGIPRAVATDVTISAGEADELAAAARQRVAAGFTTLKLKVGTDAATDVAGVRAVRDAVGTGVAIRLDANQGWSRDEAVEVIRALERADLGVDFVEQPVVAEDVEGLAWVRERVGLPLMADESCYGPWDLERIIRLGAADLVNVKLAKCGSLAVGAAMLRRAHEAGLGTIVGSMMESHIGVGAAAALVSAVPTTHVSDLDAAWWAVRSPVVGGIAYDGNVVRLADGPGLGIRGLVEDAAETVS